MTARKNPPRLLLGPLTGRIYIATRYRHRPNGVIEAQEKYDVTNEFMQLYEQATASFTYTPRPASATEPLAATPKDLPGVVLEGAAGNGLVEPKEKDSGGLQSRPCEGSGGEQL